MTAHTNGVLTTTGVSTSQPESFQISPFFRVITKPPIMGLFFCVAMCIIALVWYVMRRVYCKGRVVADSCRDPRRPAYEMLNVRLRPHGTNP
ncbi:JM51 [macacine gammaherpesvirus 11]|uniref:JM51 n=2 Tax=macacine gammaherpesvirus 11 TaxID=2560570 RepID=G9JMM9_9GAMA|nr:JM51 [Macaca fuscata rhadinovirus]AAT00028.1 JM51 [Macaca fuscata rhadinovirus]AEW87576.1 JM51 [Macaca fuscata rhadinovirus]AEW87746.1 JM51 [Macaca fuscata rhadinovirus]